MNEWDKACRYLAKQDPSNFFRWLWRFAATPLVFHSWVDTRRLALPVEGDLTCDTVAAFHLTDPVKPTHALIVEFMAESRANALDRLLAYVVRARTEPPSRTGQELPPQVGGVVINLTGPEQVRAVTVTFPGLAECDWSFSISQRTLRQESAADTLAAIAAGQTTCWLLPWIPLMHGGADASIMERWKEVALGEPDPRVRSTLASFALLFAELAGRAKPWEQALEGWNMRKSLVVEAWRDEGRLEIGRKYLLGLLRKKFDAVPDDLVQRIEAVTDIARLQAALEQVLDIEAVDELQL